MGWLIDLAKAAIQEPMSEAGAKPETSESDRLWGRVAIQEDDGQTIEHDIPSGLSEAEALALSRSSGESVRAEPVGVDPPSPPADLDALLTKACQGVEGIDAATFRALLSPEDAQDIEGGYIPVHTLNAYAKSFAEGIRTGRIRVLAAGTRP